MLVAGIGVLKGGAIYMYTHACVVYINVHVYVMYMFMHVYANACAMCAMRARRTYLVCNINYMHTRSTHGVRIDPSDVRSPHGNDSAARRSQALFFRGDYRVKKSSSSPFGRLDTVAKMGFLASLL